MQLPDWEYSLFVHWRNFIAAAVLTLAALPGRAQTRIGENLAAGMSGTIGATYEGEVGNSGASSSSHAVGVTGDTQLNGYYYSPQFLNFQVHPYYNRTQSSSSDVQIGANSGVKSYASLFSGSNFKLNFNYGRDYDNTSQWALPGASSLLSHGDSSSWGTGVSVKIARLFPVTVQYSQNDGTSSVYGIAGSDTSKNGNLSVASDARLLGTLLTLNYMRLTTNLQSDMATTSIASSNHGSSDSTMFAIARALPGNGALSANYSHTSYGYKYVFKALGATSESTASTNDGSANTLNLHANTYPTRRLDIGVDMMYNDNLTGSMAQTLASSGATPGTSTSGTIRTLTVGGDAAYSFGKGLNINALYAHEVQSYAGTETRYDQFHGNLNYTYVKSFLGSFNVLGGLVDTATQNQNGTVGLYGTLNYNKRFRWTTVGAYVSYSQDTETMLAGTTSSGVSGGATISRQFGKDAEWHASATSGNTTLSGGEGFSRSLNASAGVSLKRAACSVSYAHSNGTAYNTSTGLVSTGGTPTTVLGTNVIEYLSHSYSVGANYTALGRLQLWGSFSLARSQTSSNGSTVPSRSSRGTVQLRYPVRKMYFTAGFNRLQQGTSGSGVAVPVTNSYTIGISRWLKMF